MFNPSRDEVRDFLFESWQKFRTNLPLTAMESIAVEVIAQHPEYHELLSDAARYRERFRDREYPPEFGDTNPFLHLSMHIAIREQIAIDQPHGVLHHHTTLTQQHGDAHAAEHDMMDCLAEMIWQAQRAATAPDGGIYLACLARKGGTDNSTA